jgi:hypothetical protein
MKGLAGAPGFEPGNGGTKNRCLTTWRRPNDGAVHSRAWPRWQQGFDRENISGGTSKSPLAEPQTRRYKSGLPMNIGVGV